MSLSIKTLEHLQHALEDTCAVSIFTAHRNYRVHSLTASECTLDEIFFNVNADKVVTLSQAHVVGATIES